MYCPYFYCEDTGWFSCKYYCKATGMVIGDLNNSVKVDHVCKCSSEWPRCPIYEKMR